MVGGALYAPNSIDIEDKDGQHFCVALQFNVPWNTERSMPVVKKSEFTNMLCQQYDWSYIHWNFHVNGFVLMTVDANDGIFLYAIGPDIAHTLQPQAEGAKSTI